MKQVFKTCHVYRRPEGLYVFAVMRTPYGGITIPPAVRLTANSSPADLGDAIVGILDGLPPGVTDVDLATARNPFLAYLKESGFKNVAAFEKKASVVAVHSDGESYDIVPHRKDERGANVATGLTKLAMPRSPVELGQAVLTAFDVVSVPRVVN